MNKSLRLNNLNITEVKDPKVKNQLGEITQLESVLQSRANIADKLGWAYGGDRDIYKALGYNKSPTYEDYNAFYKRHGIGRRVVNAPVEASWRVKPQITENLNETTEFELAWEKLVKQRKIWHYLSRADRLAGIGQYGILLLGFDDGNDFKKPVPDSAELIYLRPYSQNGAKIKSLAQDTKDPKYGMPEFYSLSTKEAEETELVNAQTVHYSRVVHIAEGLESDDVYGSSRLEPILNDLQDIQKVCGGAAEMYWRGAFPGLALSAQADASMDTQAISDLEDELQAYIHQLQRYIRLQGIDIKELRPQVSDPSPTFQTLIQSISAATHIPKRILIGSERGELASSQDEINWGKFIDYRRIDFCEPCILRPFIDICIATNVLPKPAGEYTIYWPDVTVPTEKDQAEVDRIRVDTLSKYTNSIGADQLVHPEIILKRYLDFTDEEIGLNKEKLGGEINIERDDFDEFNKTQDEEE